MSLDRRNHPSLSLEWCCFTKSRSKSPPSRRICVPSLTRRTDSAEARTRLTPGYGAYVRRLVPVLIGLLALVLAAAADGQTSAPYSGSIGVPSVAPGGASVTADIVASEDCAGLGYCGFFPVVTTVPDTQSCADAVSASSWVGSVSSAAYGSTAPVTVTATASWSEWPTLFSGGKRACLYADPAGVLIAETTYQVPAPAPPAASTYTPPATAPAGSPAATTPATPSTPAAVEQFLSRAEAYGVTRGWMRKKYRRRWTLGRHKVVRCPVRSRDAQLGCFASWLYKRHVYSRSIVITKADDAYTISKDFTSAPPPPDSPAPDPSTAPSSDFCATHTCIPNYDNGTGTTVQCADGTYSHSGGKQGACSHHGGVSGSAAVARRRARTERPRDDDSRRLTELLSAFARVAVTQISR